MIIVRWHCGVSHPHHLSYFLSTLSYFLPPFWTRPYISIFSLLSWSYHDGGNLEAELYLRLFHIIQLKYSDKMTTSNKRHLLLIICPFMLGKMSIHNRFRINSLKINKRSTFIDWLKIGAWVHGVVLYETILPEGSHRFLLVFFKCSAITN